MTGDTKKATEVYKRLLGDDRTRFVGVRGMMKQKLAEGDTDTAMKLAEKAFALKPKHEEVQDILLRLQAEGGDWKGARETLGAKLRQGLLPRDVHRRRDAVLALQEAARGLCRGHNDRGARGGDRGQPPVARSDPRRRDGRAQLCRRRAAQIRRARVEKGLGRAAASRSGRRLCRDRTRRGRRPSG